MKEGWPLRIFTKNALSCPYAGGKKTYRLMSKAGRFSIAHYELQFNGIIIQVFS
jgi:hypothetical protein